MPRDDERPISIRFTDAQKAWLHEEAARQDRPIVWIVRRLVDMAMRADEQEPRADKDEEASKLAK